MNDAEFDLTGEYARAMQDQPKKEECTMTAIWILQTYFYWHELEERGFSREFSTREDAERYARNHACGSRHTIQPFIRDYWPELCDR